MENFNIKSEFVLEKFQFDQNFIIPPVKNMNADSVINIYENMRDFFPKYQENTHDIILAPRLENILDNFDALLLDAFGVLNVGSSLIPGIIKTIEKARKKDITLLIVTNGASNDSFKKRDQLASLGLEFSTDEIISSRETAEIFFSFNQPKGPLGVLGNVGNNFNIPNLSCFELEKDLAMFDEMNSFILLGTLQWDTVWQEILFNSLKVNPRPLFVANPDLVAPHEKNFSMEPAYYASHLIKNGIHLPFWLGKPFPTIFDLAINRLNKISGRHIPLSRIGMVGDTLHTDILGANSFGLKSILMTKHGLLKNTNVGSVIRKTKISPDYIVESP
jgi:HAD superfamily hydrolase (TIGR01450 family)